MTKPLKEWIHLLLPNNTKHPRILFRVDAGRVWELSFGHISRCITLARAFQELYNADTLFLMRDYPEGVKYAQEAKQDVAVLPVGLSNGQETERIIKTIEQFEANVFIVDLPYPELETSYFTYLRAQRKKLIFIDDARYISPDADVILNSSILAVEKTKQKKSSNICYLLGIDYFIIEDQREEKRLLHRQGKDDMHILITFGGSDPSGLTANVLTALSKNYWENISFSVVLGPGFFDSTQIKHSIQNNVNNIQLIHTPPDIYPFFLDSDLVICAGGRTLYELHTLNIPAFAIASITHEIPVIQTFLQKRLIVEGLDTWNEQVFSQQFDYCVTSYLSKQRSR